MTENKNELNRYSESTITNLLNLSKRLQKHNLCITFTMSLSDKSLKRILEYKGSEKSFQRLKWFIRILYQLYFESEINEKISKICIGCIFIYDSKLCIPCNTCSNNEKNKDKLNILVKSKFGTFSKKILNYYCRS